ncbi:helicase-related protein [Temperatibacter marinus]|uniref:Helicase-related protein n=1 Tax=Temperatibacter marinus TaxID=1456591 RepID=A0AA52H9Y6_9PROT|nr:helicase-related protein [Temperatibacter marinus]WND03681.1 helicase-related protein [Temperatibacter marinus]
MSAIKAVLGPTNTGKTHYAIERMLAHQSGVMGFPLRLLAREVYDRVVAAKGKNQVALITGEERIIPDGARYTLATVEAMPRHSGAHFVAIDEIQMCEDKQRGHVFTEHLLHSRGSQETLFLGSDTMERMIRRLVPTIEILRRDRFSILSYCKPLKVSKLPRRTALVGFSSDDVYAFAEILRRQKGGAAIVMGALSPRTRNAQVELYQNGEVDYLVATDAIGMGLNMEIDTIVFSGLTKFDGERVRQLRPAELGQIAGRAGRYRTNGKFTTLAGQGDGNQLDLDIVSKIEDHKFDPVKALQWRSSKLDFASPLRLIKSLEQKPMTEGLYLTRDSVDVKALKALSQNDDIAKKASHSGAVQTLWSVCQIPDFRKISDADHYSLLSRIYCDLMGTKGVIDEDFMARSVKRLDNKGGDIDTLAQRLASIRVWTYISHRKNWLKDAEHWAHVTRSVEDSLSDALHERLTQRFVDRRTAVLLKSLRQKGILKVDINNETNKVSVDGLEIGELKGFTFVTEGGPARDDHAKLMEEAKKALASEMTRRVKLFGNVGVKTLEFNFDNGLHAPRLVWEGSPLATVTDSSAMFAPRVKMLEGTLLEGENSTTVQELIQKWLDERIAEKMENLVKLGQELNGEIEAPEGTEPLSGITRGIAYQVFENFGVLPRSAVGAELRQLDQEARKGLRRFGIRIGTNSLYIPLILKPHATEMRLMMWAQKNGHDSLPTLPTPGMVWVDVEKSAPRAFYELAGFIVTGTKAIRMDMFERLADAVRPLGMKPEDIDAADFDGFFEVSPEIMGLVGLSGSDFAEVMTAIGYSHEVRQLDPVKIEKEGDATETNAEATPTEVSDETAIVNTPTEEAEKPVDVAASDTIEPDPTPAETNSEQNEATEEEKVERFFFKWAPKRFSAKPRGGKPTGKKPFKGKKPGQKGGKQQSRPSHPKKKEKVADPDSPFAALASLKDALKK